MSSQINLANDIKAILSKYSADASEALSEAVEKVAKDGAKRLRHESPTRTGKYAKGWTQTIEKSRLTISAVIHGKSGTYQLAHLLENGHLNRNGTRTKAIKHIKPVEMWVGDEVVRQTIKKLENL